MRKIAKLIVLVSVFLFCFDAYACQDFGETCILDSSCCGGMTCGLFGCACENSEYPNYCKQGCWGNCSSGYEFVCTGSGGECHTICSDQCSVNDLWNSPYCSGSYSLTCEYGNDGCLDETGHSCAFGCSGLTGECNLQPYDPCEDIKCCGGNEWCYDSDGDKNYVNNYCGSDELYCSQDYCQNGNVVYDDIDIDRGCSNDDCFEYDNSSTVTVETCACGCSGGNCIYPCCTNECTAQQALNSPYCEGSYSLTCSLGNDDCFNEISQACAYGCNNLTGHCFTNPPCENDCFSVGEKQCVNSLAIKTCGNYDTDNCLEWGNAQSCQCFNDSCQTCTGQCDLGTIGCSTNNASKWSCIQNQNDGCTDKYYTSCNDGEVCESGICVNDCLPVQDHKDCKGNLLVWKNSCDETTSTIQDCSAMPTICNSSFNGLWSDGFCSTQDFVCYYGNNTACECGCENNQCKAPCCENECSANQALISPYCDGPYSKTCQLSGDCFTEAGQSCAYGCNELTGQCFTTQPCDNECNTNGKTECINQNSLRTCGDFDDDNCLEWGNLQSCKCFNDSCQNCTDQCDLSDVGCSTNKVSKWNCIQNPIDGCTDKSYTACSAGKVCEAGVCVNDCLPAQDHKACLANSLVWENSCNEITSTIQDCSAMPTICNETFDGLWSDGFCSTQDFVCYYGKNNNCECGCQNDICITPCCEDECEQNETGCKSSAMQWLCSYNSNTKCFEKELTACQLGTSCVNGECAEPVQNCEIISAYWETGNPEAPNLAYDGMQVEIVVVTQGCEGKSVDITIKEDTMILPDDFVFGICAYIPNSGILSYKWEAAYWDNNMGGALFELTKVILDEMEANLYASIKIIGTNEKKNSDILHVLPSIGQIKDLDKILKENPILQMSECLSYSSEEVTENCMNNWESLGLAPMHHIVEFINDEDVRLVGTVITCKAMEHGGWMICAGGTAGTLGLGAPVACAIGGGVTIAGVLCDVFKLPPETFVVDQIFWIDVPGFVLASFAKVARKAKLFDFLLDATKKYKDEGWVIVKQVITEDLGGMLKISKGEERRVIAYTFKEGAEDATKIVFREVRVMDDYVGSKQLLDWVEKWDVPIVSYKEATPDMLIEACSWFKNGKWDKSYSDVMRIAEDIKVDPQIIGFELVDTASFFAANQNGLIKFSTRITSVAGIKAAEQLYGHAVKHEVIHSIFHAIFSKLNFSKTPVSNLIYDSKNKVTVILNPALEFIVDNIYLKKGDPELIAEFKKVGSEKLLKQYSSMKYKWIEWFKATGSWDEPYTTSLTRAYALSTKYDIPGLMDQIKKDLLDSFIEGTPESVKKIAFDKLETMAAELTVNSDFIVENLKHISENTNPNNLITKETVELVVDKYKIYEFGDGDFIDISDYSLSDDMAIEDCEPQIFVGCFDNQVISFNSCGEVERVLQVCEDGYECEESTCKAVNDDTTPTDNSNFKVIDSGCNVRSTWLLYGTNNESLIKNCKVNFGDGTEKQCSFEILSPVVIRIFAEHGYVYADTYNISMQFNYNDQEFFNEIETSLDDCPLTYDENLISNLSVKGKTTQGSLIYAGDQIYVSFFVSNRPGMNGDFAEDFAKATFKSHDLGSEEFVYVARNMHAYQENGSYLLELVYETPCNAIGEYEVTVEVNFNGEIDVVSQLFTVKDSILKQCAENNGCKQSNNSQPQDLILFAFLMLIIFLFKRRRIIN